MSSAFSLCLLVSSFACAGEPHMSVVEPPSGFLHTAVLSVSADGLSSSGYSFGLPREASFVLRRDSLPQHFFNPSASLIADGISDDGGTLCVTVTPSYPEKRFIYVGEIGGEVMNRLEDTSSHEYVASGMSGDGSTVYGYRLTMPQYTSPRTFIWRPGDVAPTLLDTTTPFGEGNSSPSIYMAIDSTGTKVVGTIGLPDQGMLGGVWIDGLFEPFRAREQDYLASILATSISRNGQYYGGGYNGRAAIWKDGEPYMLLMGDPSALSTTFVAVADHGQLACARTRVWTRERGDETAAEFLAAHGAPVPPPWRVEFISSISSDGSVIGGYLFDPVPSLFRGFVAYTSYRPCFADFNGDGGVDGADIESFFLTWQSGVQEGDVNMDGGVDGSDIEAFFSQWVQGGCVS
jgi:hypothetical protein